VKACLIVLKTIKVSGTFIAGLGSAAGAERRFQAEFGHRSLRPQLVAIRYTPLHAPPNRQELQLRLRLIHVFDPTGLSRQRPRGQELAVLGMAPLPAKQASPAASFSKIARRAFARFST
jgi:hypothetical protein